MDSTAYAMNLLIVTVGVVYILKLETRKLQKQWYFLLAKIWCEVIISGSLKETAK